MKIIAFAGSNSKNSINKKLATYAASLFEHAEVEVIDLNDYEMPLFGVDIEREIGQHAKAQSFIDKLATADMLIISLAENNGNYSTAFKNIFDWCSRIMKNVFQDKNTLLMATSPGSRGGKGVLDIAQNNLPRYGVVVNGVFSLPSFEENFDVEKGKIINEALDNELKEIVSNFNKT